MRRFVTIAIAASLLGSPLAGCGASNIKTAHSGRFDERRPIIAMGTCCIGYDPTEDVEAMFANDANQPDLWLPVCDKDGTPWPAGHRHDVYFTGDTVRKFHAKRPAAYRYEPPPPGERGRFSIDLARSWKGFTHVDFHEFKAMDDGTLTDEGTAEVKAWLRAHYGKAAKIVKLGEGGFSVAYRVCRDERDCVVVKIRKMTPTFADWKRIQHATDAASELKRDLAISEVADAVTSWVRYVDTAGAPVPLMVDGKPLGEAPTAPQGPAGRLARAGMFTNAKFLAEGAVEQKLIAFYPSPASVALLNDAGKVDSPLHKGAVEQAAAAGAPPERVTAFFSNYNKVSRIGPDVIKVTAFVRACDELAKVPTIRDFCMKLRHDFAIPDDFLDRVTALEWMYRDSAADVIRFSRANFGRALGNGAADGVFREIGLDFNHGRNAGWDPATRQFVLFDF